MNIHIRNKVTYEDFSRVMRACSLDPEKVIMGEADLADAKYPGRKAAWEVLRLIIRDRWKIRRLEDEAFKRVFAETAGLLVSHYTSPEADADRIIRRLASWAKKTRRRSVIRKIASWG